jgi:hypothetical protein
MNGEWVYEEVVEIYSRFIAGSSLRKQGEPTHGH